MKNTPAGNKPHAGADLSFANRLQSVPTKASLNSQQIIVKISLDECRYLIP